jgi:hypothetical protein
MINGKKNPDCTLIGHEKEIIKSAMYANKTESNHPSKKNERCGDYIVY